jgi:hypothetical protein
MPFQLVGWFGGPSLMHLPLLWSLLRGGNPVTPQWWVVTMLLRGCSHC